MRRGTRVGQAYVAVTADGSGINEEIVDSVDEAGPGVEKAGKEHGDRYGDGFADSLDSVDFDRFADRIGDAFAQRMASHGDDAGKEYGDRFEKSMRKMSKRIGKNISESISDAMSGELSLLINNMVAEFSDQLDAVSRNAGRGGGGSGGGSGSGSGSQSAGAPQTLYKSYDFATMFEAARVKMHRDSNKAIQADDVKLLKSQQAMYDSVLKMEENKAAFISKFENAQQKLREQSNAVIFKDDQKLFADQKALHDSLAKAAIKRDAEVWAVRRASAAAHAKYLSGLEKGSTDTRGNAVLGSRSNKGGIDDVIGSMFGKGSRNNALNMLGSMMKNVVGLVGQGQKFATGFADGITRAGEGANLIEKALGGLKGGGAATSVGSGFMSIAKGGPAAVVAIVAVIAAMSAMVSVAGALLAIITALASTIVSGLVGALLVLAPALLAVVAGAGLLTAAFMSMTDAQKSLLANAFQPLKAEMVGLGQLMLQDMVPAFGTWSANLQQALLLALPLAQQLGSTFAEAGNIMTASFSGPGFQLLATSLGVFLPSILIRLTQAFASFTNGAAGTFAALMPLVNRFAGYLASVTARFSAWANSAQGQNSIVDFANRAVASLQSLWNFVREFSGFIFDVLFDRNAQTAGNSIFDSLADSFAGLREKLAAASADGSLKKWFNDAIEFGGQLWEVIRALSNLFIEFYDSGMLQSIGNALGAMATALDLTAQYVDPLIGAVGGLATALGWMLSPIGLVIDGLDKLTEKAGGALNLLKSVAPVGGYLLDAVNGGSDSGGGGGGGYNPLNHRPGTAGNGLGVLAPQQPSQAPAIDLNSLISSGNTALGATSMDSGGYKPAPVKAQWKNPYVEYANSLIKDGPSEMTKVREAMNKANRTFKDALRAANDSMVETLRTENKNAAKAIRSAAQEDSAEGVRSTLQNVVESMQTQAANAAQQIRSSAKSTAGNLRNSADSVVAGARAALNSAASSLAGASTPEAATKALAAVATAQKAVDAADKAAEKMNKKATKLVEKAKARAKKLREQTKAANAIIKAQEVLSVANVNALVAGKKVGTATMADYAEARAQVAVKIEAANQKLAEAISLRDNYKTAISDSIKAFGALTTAQAKVIDGVEQALTATDITSNLQDRLAKIKTFQSNLQILLSQGLSDAAYKQILDMGVEGGSAYAQALVDGGQGAVSATNELTGQIGGIADQLGLDASSRLYQAGVDAAQGLVDGLMSLSAELDSAATQLGEAIANAVKKALGIASPSRVLIGMMDHVGDGAVIGLDNQSDKVGRASERFSSNIAVSPEVAAYASSQGSSPTVSGNNDDPRFRDLIISTPSTDPLAVAHEALNEITGRI